MFGLQKSRRRYIIAMSSLSAFVSAPRAVASGICNTISPRRGVPASRPTVRASASDDATASVRIFDGSSSELLFGAQQNMLGLLESSSTDDAAISSAIDELEKLNPTNAPAKDSKLLGKWRLAWSAQQSNSNFFQKLFADIASDNFQIINANETLENLVLIGPLTVSATAPIKAVSDTRTEVQITTVNVSLGATKVWSKELTPKPGRGAGWVEQLYLDDTLRISKGNKGSLFVHLREGDNKGRSDTESNDSAGGSTTALAKR